MVLVLHFIRLELDSPQTIANLGDDIKNMLSKELSFTVWN